MLAAATARRRHARLELAAVVFGVVCAVVLLRVFPPESSRFYPVCPFFAFTGFECPGCGMTRALAALVRGEVRAAWGWNPLSLPLVASLGWAGVKRYAGGLRGLPVAWPRVSRLQAGLVAAGVVVFAVLRNL